MEAYGEWWFRLWSFFLAWASQVAKEGQSTCFQILCNKNTRKLDRKMFFGGTELGERSDTSTLATAHERAAAHFNL